MKILVFSDSHHITEPMKKAIKEQSPDMVIHLGDCVKDIKEVSGYFPKLQVIILSGNNDYGFITPSEKEITLSGKRFFITHGHRYGVKYSLNSLIDNANLRKADVLLFGHTHIPYNAFEYGMYIINPGSCSGIFGTPPTFAVLTLEEGKISSEILEIK